MYVILYVTMYFSYFISLKSPSGFVRAFFFLKRHTLLKYVIMIPHMQLQFPVFGSFGFSVCCAVCVVHVLKVMEQARGRQYLLFAELSVKNIAWSQAKLLKRKMPFTIRK